MIGTILSANDWQQGEKPEGRRVSISFKRGTSFPHRRGPRRHEGRREDDEEESESGVVGSNGYGLERVLVVGKSRGVGEGSVEKIDVSQYSSVSNHLQLAN